MATNKKDGLLIQDGDPYSMAGAIIELISNQTFANNLGKNARATGLGRNNPKKIIEQLTNIYQSVIKEGYNR